MSKNIRNDCYTYTYQSLRMLVSVDVCMYVCVTTDTIINKL